MTTNGSSLDRFLGKITADVVRAGIEKVSYTDVEIDDEDSLLEQLNNDLLKDSVIETTSLSDLPEIKSEDISNAYVHERCCNLVEDTIIEVYDELQRIFNSNDQNMSNDIESSKKQLLVLDCIKDSDRLQAYFQELSLSIVQNALEKIVEESKQMEPYLDSDIKSDIEIESKQGSESNIEKNLDNNIDNTDYELNSQDETSLRNENTSVRENSQVDSVVQNEDLDSGQSVSGSLGFTTANSTMEQTTEHDGSFTEDSFVSAKTQENGEHTTADSAMFTTADDFKENSSVFLSFNSPQESTIIIQSPPVDSSDVTLTAGPRQSTPLIDDKTTLSSAEESSILSGPYQSTPTKENNHESTSAAMLSGDVQHDVTEYEKTLQELSGDESSFGEPSTPRTLSRQSSAFGNVTLEFDTDWEASMKRTQEEAGTKPRSEEKHKVILHELSFEDHGHRLKAPELLCPVFLAVQDDEFDEERKKKQRMSQSIDDLCEMISEDSDDDQDLPLRRRAMSLEGKKPPSKEQRKKAPTREELMAAFEELQHEIMEEKELEDEGTNELNEEQKETSGGETMDNQEHGLDDPLRWHTVVFNGQHKVIDLKLLEPFLKVLTHGGYHHEGDKKTVIVVLTACNLPNKKMKRYPFLMEQLFFFIISTMDLLVTSEEYIFVYFHGGTSKNQSPSFSWLKKYYQYIDHRLRKSVTKVYVVHPNLWLKSVFRLCRPFSSSNFARKLKFVSTLKELSSHIKTDFIYIPDEVIKVDPDYRKLHAS